MKFVDGESGPNWAFDGDNRVLALTLGLSPIWLAAFAYLTSSPSSGGISPPSAPAQVAGLPIWMLLWAVAAAMTIAGAIVIWRARTPRTVLAAFALLTIPAVVLALLGPAFVVVFRSLVS